MLNSNIETRIANLTEALTEARKVVYTVRGEDGEFTFTAPTPEAARIMMGQLHAMADFIPMLAMYADAPGAPSPSECTHAHDEHGRLVPCSKEVI